MPQAPGDIEGSNAIPKDTWQVRASAPTPPHLPLLLPPHLRPHLHLRRTCTSSRAWQANLARCLLEQPWVLAESVRTIQASLVPIVSFATRFTGAGGRPLRLDVSFEGAQHLGLSTNELVMRSLAERPPPYSTRAPG